MFIRSCNQTFFTLLFNLTNRSQAIEPQRSAQISLNALNIRKQPAASPPSPTAGVTNENYAFNRQGRLTRELYKRLYPDSR